MHLPVHRECAVQTVNALCNVRSLNSAPGAKYALHMHCALHYKSTQWCILYTAHVPCTAMCTCCGKHLAVLLVHTMQLRIYCKCTVKFTCTEWCARCPMCIAHAPCTIPCSAVHYKSMQWCTWCTVYTARATHTAMCTTNAL